MFSLFKSSSILFAATVSVGCGWFIAKTVRNDINAIKGQTHNRLFLNGVRPGFYFNWLSRDDVMVKFLGELWTHHGYKYKLGLNIDTKEFIAGDDCEPGGLYFTSGNHAHKFLDMGSVMAEVTIPWNSMVQIQDGKFKANKLIISNVNPVLIHPMIRQYPYKFQLPYIIAYAKDSNNNDKIIKELLVLANVKN